jgi:von Willebrand factor type A domain
VFANLAILAAVGNSAADAARTVATSAPDALTRIRYETRLQSFSQWWQTPLLVLICVLVLAHVAYWYRRDSVELKRGVGIILAILRLAAFSGLLLAYLDVQKRSETKVVYNSRVILLADTSLSMARIDSDDQSPGGAAPARRIDQIATMLAEGTLLDQLRQTHDVTVIRFDSDLRRIVTLPRYSAEQTKDTAKTESKAKDSDNEVSSIDSTIDWHTQLQPQGLETRLSQAVRQVISDERGAPVSAIVVFSDGAQNAGVDVAAAIKAAQEAKIPVHCVAIGSATLPTDVRVSDLVAPPRAYPGDSFRVTGYLQSQGLNGRRVTVELTVRDAEQKDANATPQVEKTEQVTLSKDSETISVRFEIPGLTATGRRIVRLHVKPLPEIKDQHDLQREVEVDIVDRKNRVLLFAGGPSREYQFLRNMLRRSELAKSGQTVVDVLLQSAGEGISQDASQIRSEFPRSMQELSQYDTIVAFDPDWRELDQTQIALLEKWVGEESGGLIVIAGPVFTDAWVQNPAMNTIRALYPVEFNRRLALLEDARYGSQQPWPLEFTREGLEAEFLWLDDDAGASRAAWDAFKGVFGYYRVRGAKPGATVYALYSDPDAASGDQKPAYFAGQFYGSGRVFYLASGEMWRLRALDEKYFDTFYTKLIRHVSQGRLLRGSRMGSLFVERERYVIGNTVVVRAQLSNSQQQPLDVPKVTLQVVQPTGPAMSVPLAADPVRKGMYTGQFTVTQEGEYHLELENPVAPNESLSKRLQVFMPKLEQEHPERNDKLLKELSDGSGGLMYIGTQAAFGPQSQRPLVGQLEDKTRETYVSGRKDRDWEEAWLHWLLALICGCLCLEWLLRRLYRLA